MSHDFPTYAEVGERNIRDRNNHYCSFCGVLLYPGIDRVDKECCRICWNQEHQ